MDISGVTEEIMVRIERAKKGILCNISARHVHLKVEDIEKLFGSGYKLTKLRDLMQPGEYASKNTVDIMGPKKIIKKVRVLGPPRNFSQVEVSRTDAYSLGINAEVRVSGDIKSSSPIRLIGSCGSVELSEGLIVARRHIHMTPTDAKIFKIEDLAGVRVRTKPPRSIIFEDVLVRVNEDFKLECHLDFDEANACDLKNGAEVFLI